MKGGWGAEGMVTEVGVAMGALEGVVTALLEEVRGEGRGVETEEVTLGLVGVVKEGGLGAREVEEMGTLGAGATLGVVMGVEGMVIWVGVE